MKKIIYDEMVWKMLGLWKKTGCGGILQAGGLTWHDLVYESAAGLHSATCVNMRSDLTRVKRLECSEERRGRRR